MYSPLTSLSQKIQSRRRRKNIIWQEQVERKKYILNHPEHTIPFDPWATEVAVGKHFLDFLRADLRGSGTFAAAAVHTAVIGSFFLTL